MIEQIRARRAAAKAELDALVTIENGPEARALTADESSKFDELAKSIKEMDERVNQLVEQENSDRKAADAVRDLGIVPAAEERKVGGAKVGDEAVYRKDTRNVSFFRDLSHASRGIATSDELARLHRNTLQVQEKRAGDTTVNGAGGEFVPPLWLVDEYISLPRPGRVTADRFNKKDLPTGTDSISLPKITGGTKVFAPAQVSNAQNTALQEQDITTSSVTVPVVTTGGGQTLALQLIEQSPISMDEVIYEDLMLEYNRTLSTEVLVGTGAGHITGLTKVSGIEAVTFAPTGAASAGPGWVAALYSKVLGAIAGVNASRFLPPTAIVMHPTRWSYLSAQVDANQRPLIVPTSNGPQNAFSTDTSAVAQGYVGVFAGLPVYVDPNITTNNGTGTNEDYVLVSRFEDNVLFEGTPRVEAFPQTFANNLSLYIRLYNYTAFLSRYAGSTAVLSGNGFVTPSF